MSKIQIGITSIDNSIIADRDTLRDIYLLAREASRSYEKRGRTGMAEDAKEFYDAIYDALSVREAQIKFSRSCEICCFRGLQIKCGHCAIAVAHKLTVAALNEKEEAK